MDEFLDSLSKRLASTLTRREMLRIASGTVFGALALSTLISRVWGKTAPAPGGPNSSTCGAVQNTIQLALGDEDPARYKDHHEYVRAVERFAHRSVEGELITKECSDCIVGQFRASVSIASQYPCGSFIAPSETCDAILPTKRQINAASELALSAVPNAWGDSAQWVKLVQLSEAMLGCTLGSAGQTTASTLQIDSTTRATGALVSTTGLAAAAATSTCAAAGVNYCGPGNSGDPSNPNRNWLPTVATCLNEACCVHDNCYADVCEPLQCYFTTNSTCDNPLLATCLGFGSCSSSDILDSPATEFVCAVVLCLELPTQGSICQDIQRQRVPNPTCAESCIGSSCCPSGTTCMTATTVVPGAITGVCCPPGNNACGNTCCPPGSNCINGACGCAAGTTACGNNCCTADQICQNGACMTCPAGQAPCGSVCCPPGGLCLDGTCAKNPCPSGLSACGKICCAAGQTCANGACTTPNVCTPTSCPTGQPCCTNFLGQAGCGPAGYSCCPTTGNACPPGETCCDVITGPSSASEFCCGSGSVCFRSGVFAACCPAVAGYYMCTIPGSAGWCCAGTQTCGTFVGSCVGPI
jgi:hypothetical protein